MKILDLELKNKLIELGYLKSQKHPTEDLWIYNYTQIAQFDKKAFIEYPILRECRGLVLDVDGEVVARAFGKFWNFEEYGEGSILGELPHYDSFEITDKLDGSLGIVFQYKDKIIIATRGSFESEQSKWATEHFKTLVESDFKIEGNLTLLFEIIYPENRIVVSYGEEKKMVFLACIYNETGEQQLRNHSEQLCEAFGFEIVRMFDGMTDFKQCRELMKRDNAEGFVIRFLPSGLRVKMKYEEYVRLHKILTGISSKTIWEMLKNKDDFALVLEKVPDEFMAWVDSTKKKLELEYFRIDLYIDKAYNEIPQDVSRKEQALFILKNHKIISSMLFNMLDGKDYTDSIWRMIQPKYEQPFKTEV